MLDPNWLQAIETTAGIVFVNGSHPEQIHQSSEGLKWTGSASLYEQLAHILREDTRTASEP